MSNPQATTRLLQGIEDPRVREAFEKVDRARFVPDDLRSKAWADHPLPIEDEATISQPSLVAKMTEWTEIGPGHRVLEIGTGSGYQTAILAELADEVATVEYSSILGNSARQRLGELGYDNIQFRIGDGAQGWPEHAPYERILSTVAFADTPTVLLDQLRSEEGLALVPVGPPGGVQRLTLYRRDGDRILEEELTPVRFLSLR
ncbi:MAG: protein-L-isoaspartate(D-aspartate) O-methyltransferase [Akkermansiaceae bacterium]|nr:protein-L-isoaspartate(D-aspartate) O-methyltransferase [Akkermansiaceae bacterium]